MATKKIAAKKVVKKVTKKTQSPEQKISLAELLKDVTAIYNGKKAGVVIVSEVTKTGMTIVSASHKYQMKHIETLINELIKTVRPDIAALAETMKEIRALGITKM